MAAPLPGRWSNLEVAGGPQSTCLAVLPVAYQPSPVLRGTVVSRNRLQISRHPKKGAVTASYLQQRIINLVRQCKGSSLHVYV